MYEIWITISYPNIFMQEYVYTYVIKFLDYLNDIGLDPTKLMPDLAFIDVPIFRNIRLKT